MITLRRRYKLKSAKPKRIKKHKISSYISIILAVPCVLLAIPLLILALVPLSIAFILLAIAYLVRVL